MLIMQNNSIHSNPYLDKRAEIEIDDTDILPHWYQEGKIQSVTFRLADSLPQSKLDELRELRARFEASHPQPWGEDMRREYYGYISPYENKMLDSGYGSCVLREQSLRQKMVDVFETCNDDVKFKIIAYVIMPNHVHMLVLVNQENLLNKVIVKAKKISGYYINQVVGSTGRVWMKSYFDRIIRSADGLKHAVQYIINNPRHLPASDYTLYVNTSLVDRFGNWLG